jgi:hypothetical protein
VRLRNLPRGDVRADPPRARRLHCGSSDAAHCIELHWRGRDQAGLVQLEPGKWAGPCPKDGRPRALHVIEGDNGAVVWAVPGCKGVHDREAAYPALKTRVPCAPDPGHRHNPELEALQDTMMMLAVNKALTPAALRLALLEAAGTGTEEALDVLGITDSGNRRRARLARDKALSPAPTVKTDSKARPKQVTTKNVDESSTFPRARPAKTRLPAATVKTDSQEESKLTVAAGRESAQKEPLTSTFASLTDGATLVSGPPGPVRDTDTALDLALELVRTKLGAEVIEPAHDRRTA